MLASKTKFWPSFQCSILRIVLVSETTSSLSSNAPIHATHFGMLNHRNFSIIHKKDPCGGIELIALSLHRYNHSLSTSITNLLTGRSRCRRAISVAPDAPSMNFTLLTNLFLSAFVATMFPIDQLFHSVVFSLSRTISPTLMFLL